MVKVSQSQTAALMHHFNALNRENLICPANKTKHPFCAIMDVSKGQEDNRGGGREMEGNAKSSKRCRHGAMRRGNLYTEKQQEK